MRSWCTQLESSLTRLSEIQDEMRGLHDLAAQSVLRGARVIGVTSTGAAKYKDLLQDPEVAPGVVLVEEAGELLEAHTLTSLSARTKQLIMVRVCAVVCVSTAFFPFGD